VGDAASFGKGIEGDATVLPARQHKFRLTIALVVVLAACSKVGRSGWGHGFLPNMLYSYWNAEQWDVMRLAVTGPNRSDVDKSSKKAQAC
jgi:hypothetical protein